MGCLLAVLALTIAPQICPPWIFALLQALRSGNSVPAVSTTMNTWTGPIRMIMPRRPKLSAACHQNPSGLLQTLKKSPCGHTYASCFAHVHATTCEESGMVMRRREQQESCRACRSCCSGARVLLRAGCMPRQALWRVLSASL